MISYLSTRLPKSSAVNVGIVYLVNICLNYVFFFILFNEKLLFFNSQLGALVVAAYIRHENQLDGLVKY